MSAFNPGVPLPNRKFSVAKRDNIDALLQDKHFLLLPMPVLHWINRQHLRPTAYRLFLLYWSDAMCRQGTLLVTRMTTGFAASLLDVSKDAVRCANRQLVEAGLIRRTQEKDDAGQTICMHTQIGIPGELQEFIEQSPDRTRSPSPSDGPSNQVDPPSSTNHEHATKSIDQRVDSNAMSPDVRQEELKSRIREANRRLSELWKQRLPKKALLEAHSQIVQEIAQLESKLKQSPPPEQKTQQKQITRERQGSSEAPRKGELEARHINYIRGKISEYPFVSAPNNLVHEICFQLTKGVYGASSNMPIMKGIHICLKMVRNNLWRTPAGFSEAMAGGGG